MYTRRGNCYCVWKNAYDPALGVCRMDLDLFEKVGETYVRSTDALYERLYSGRFLQKAAALCRIGERPRRERRARLPENLHSKIRADYRSHFDLLPGVTEIFAAVEFVHAFKQLVNVDGGDAETSRTVEFHIVEPVADRIERDGVVLPVFGIVAYSNAHGRFGVRRFLGEIR